MEIPIREENKRTISEKEAKFILEQAIDPDFDNFYEGDIDRVLELPRHREHLVLFEEVNEQFPPEVV